MLSGMRRLKRTTRQNHQFRPTLNQTTVTATNSSSITITPTLTDLRHSFTHPINTNQENNHMTNPTNFIDKPKRKTGRPRKRNPEQAEVQTCLANLIKPTDLIWMPAKNGYRKIFIIRAAPDFPTNHHQLFPGEIAHQWDVTSHVAFAYDLDIDKRYGVLSHPLDIIEALGLNTLAEHFSLENDIERIKQDGLSYN